MLSHSRTNTVESHQSTKPNTRQQSTPLPQSVFGTVDHHPVLHTALSWRSSHYAHGTAPMNVAHQTACSTSHASEPLRGLSLHWCGAARNVMTWSIETNDDTQPFKRAKYNAKHPNLNPNIPHPVQTRPTEVPIVHCPDQR